MHTMRMSLFAIAAVGAVNIGAATQVLWQNLGQVKQLRPALAIGAKDDIIVAAGEVCTGLDVTKGKRNETGSSDSTIFTFDDANNGALLWESVTDASGLCVAAGGAPVRANNSGVALVKTESPSQPEAAGTF